MFKLTWGITHDGNSKIIMRIPQLYVKGKGEKRNERSQNDGEERCLPLCYPTRALNRKT